jgi:long-chain acyl-CoA synthetase
MPYRSLIEYLAAYTRHGGDVAYVDKHGGYRAARSTYRDVMGVATQLAAELDMRGVKPGDRVMLWGRNSAEWVAAIFGCILLGAIAVPMDQDATADFAERVAQQVEAKLVIASPEHASLGAGWPVLRLDSLRESVARHSSDAFPSPPLDRSSPAQIIFTSGTTAEPKGVVISHGNMLANLEPIESAMQPYLKWERFVHPLRFLDLVPLSHVFGQFLGVWIPPLLGATVIFQDTLNPAEIISTIQRERASVLIAVPRILQALQQKIERDFEAEGKLAAFHREFAAAANEKILRRMWRFRRIHRCFGWKFWAVISGGATLDAATELFWNRIGFAAIQGYGLTETTSLVTLNHPFRVGRGSIGKVLAGREIKLDPSGEILVRGESIASGYWQGGGITPVGSNADTYETPGDSGKTGGWFRTGDLGELDAQGNLYFKGRKKDAIVTPAGMNVYPADVEAALRHEPEIKDCVVIGLARRGNAEPFAVLLMRNPEEMTRKQDGEAAQAVARANAALAEYQRVHQWLVWPEADFPRTSTGKPKTTQIRAAVEGQLLSAGSGRAALTEQGRASGGIIDLIERIRGAGMGKTIASKSNLEHDLNLSSLDRVELLGAIEDRYQIDLNETTFTGATTVNDLERLVREATPGRSEFVFPRWAQRWPVTWLRTLIYYLLTWPATNLMAHPRVRGSENLRGVKGPMLVICNHVLYLDVGFVLAALPWRFRNRLAVAMGGERLAEMRSPPREWFFLRRWLHRMNYFLVVSLFNVFPLPKISGFRESFRFAGDLVDRGWSVLIFPEGGQTPDGTLQPFRAGIGILANNLKIPVVPMRIDGAYEIREAHSRFNRPGRIRVYIGKPVEFPAASDPQQIARVLEQRVAMLGDAHFH